MVMVHGDNRGLILPPNVANIQVSIECMSPIFSVIHVRVHVLYVFALHFVFTEACFYTQYSCTLILNSSSSLGDCCSMWYNSIS